MGEALAEERTPLRGEVCCTLIKTPSRRFLVAALRRDEFVSGGVAGGARPRDLAIRLKRRRKYDRHCRANRGGTADDSNSATRRDAAASHLAGEIDGQALA